MLAGLVTIGCEPTGHRWRVLGQLAADRGMPFVCVQPMLSSWARKTEDLTCDKTDDEHGADREADRAAALPPARAGG